MSARLATERQWPVAVDGAVHVHDAQTDELLAVHEAPDVDLLRDELRRMKARLVERTALVVACEAALADTRDYLDEDHPADRFLRLRIESVLRRIAAEVVR